MSRRGWLLFLVLCLIWGIPYLLIRVAVRELVDVARDPGSGWVDYKYANPTQGYAVQPKTSYVHGIDGTWLIAAGTYLPQK